MPVIDSIIDVAGQLVPGTHVGICIADDTGTLTTLAGTDSLVFALDDMQAALDQGPSLTAVREGHTVIIDDAESEHRWPRFMPYAVNVGLRSYLGMPICLEDQALGGLNLYSTTHAHLDADRLAHARVFAAQAAVALGQSRRENHLAAALQSSRTIGKAIGMTMERFDLDDEEAFSRLARLSQKSNVKLRDLAAHLVKQSNDLRHVTQAGQTLVQQPPAGHLSLPRRDATSADSIDPSDGWPRLRNPGDRDEVTELLPGL
jgi:GAF domain-containing protein